MGETRFPEWFEAKWTDSRLDALRHQGDPLADAAVSLILQDKQSAAAQALLSRLRGQSTQAAEGVAPSAEEFRESLRAIPLTAEQESSLFLPEWMDQAAVDRAYQFMLTHGVRYNMVLLFLSLPVLYAWSTGGAQTLAMTGQLSDKFGRRVAETLRFVVSVIRLGGMGPTGDGVATTLKIRSMHAGIRHYAKLAQCPDGDNFWRGDWGVPINQEQLLATMLSFSTLAVDGLRKLGVRVSEQEDRDLLALWRTIGFVLGIDPANFPETTEEARLLWKKMDQRNFAGTGAGQLLTSKHISFVASLANGEDLLTHAFRGADIALLRYLLGSRIGGKMLGVPRYGLRGIWVLFVFLLFRQVERIIDRPSFARRWLDRHANGLLLKLEKFWDSRESPRPFKIPDQQDAEAGLGQACALRNVA